MNWIERFLSHFQEDDRYDDLQPEHMQAFTDVMALAMTVDRHIAIEERETITEILRQLPMGTFGSEHAVNQGVRTAWDMLEADEPTRLVYYKALSQKLQFKWLRYKAYEAAYRIIQSDEQIVPLESRLLENLARAFDIPNEDVARVLQHLEVEHLTES